jgi:hypothetical protein
MALSEKYKGKTFAEVATEINNKYKNRYDPISLNGLNSEMGNLRESQDQAKAQQEQQQQSQSQGMPQVATNNGMSFNPQEQMGAGQPQQTFNNAQSQQYNEKFGYGGELGMAMQLAPAVAGAYQLANLERSAPVDRHTINTNQFLSQLQANKPRQTRFDEVDFNEVDRAATEGAARFTQSNINASSGNAGAFMANELANNQGLTRTLSGARLQAQQQNQQTAQLNAQEQARIDQFGLEQNAQAAQLGLRGAMFNSQVKSQADELDASNLAGYNNTKMGLSADIAGSVGDAGYTLFTASNLSKQYGYDIFNKYGKGTKKEKADVVKDFATKSSLTEKRAAEILEEVNSGDISPERLKELEQMFQNTDSQFKERIANNLGPDGKKRIRAYGGKLSTTLRNLRKI